MFEEQVKEATKVAIDTALAEVPMVKALLAGEPLEIVVQPITIQLRPKQ